MTVFCWGEPVSLVFPEAVKCFSGTLWHHQTGQRPGQSAAGGCGARPPPHNIGVVSDSGPWNGGFPWIIGMAWNLFWTQEMLLPSVIQNLRFRAQKGIPLEALVVQTVGANGVMYYASFEYLALNKAKMRPHLAYGAVVSSGEESDLELCLCVCSARQWPLYVPYRQDCVEQLLKNMFDGDQMESCLVSGMQVLLALLEPRRVGWAYIKHPWKAVYIAPVPQDMGI